MFSADDFISSANTPSENWVARSFEIGWLDLVQIEYLEEN